MRVARYFLVPEDVLQQFEERNNQFRAFDDLPGDEPYVVLKLIKAPKVKAAPAVEEAPSA